MAIVYLESFDTRSGALKREHQLKRLRRDRKAALVMHGRDILAVRVSRAVSTFAKQHVFDRARR